MPRETLQPIGMNVDQPPEEVEDEWTDGQNVLVQDGQAIRALGWDAVFGTLDVAPRFLLFVEGNPDQWIYTGAALVSVTDGTTHTNITPVGLSAINISNLYTGGRLNALPFLNNGIDVPYFWDGDLLSIMVPLPGWPAGQTVRTMRPFKFNLVGMNVSVSGTDFPDQVVWSDSADAGAVPQEWTPTAANDAGDVALSATPGALVDGLALRGNFIIYKQHSAYLMTHVGGQFVFAFRKLFVTLGALAPNCIVEKFGKHYVFADGDIVETDGHNVRSLIDRRVKRAVFGTMNQDAFERSYVVLDDPNSRIYFCYATGISEEVNQAVVWNWAEDKISFRSLPVIPHMAAGVIEGGSSDWDSQASAWDVDVRRWSGSGSSPADERLLMADLNNTKLLKLDSSPTEDGTNVEAFVAKESMHFGKPELVKTALRVWPRMRGSAGALVKVRVGSQFKPDDPIDWNMEQDFVLGTTEKLDVDRTGRFLSVQFRSDSAPVWGIDSFDVEYTDAGLF